MEKHECRDFVGRWMCVQTLGEGAYGEVKLLMHRVSGETVAVKIVDLKKHKDAAECVRKEVRIHSILDHPNIIKLYGSRREDDKFTEYIYLEYAAGGELFNKIEPDIGMDYLEAQKYMKQLLAGIEYLHQRGIAHRDIKPENLLLDTCGNLKISDFGMATLFRLKGRERLLAKRCGTLPYVAPEVLIEAYHAQSADIWSCGIVLITMVAGELPWDEPTHNCNEYAQWTTDEYLLITPWSKLDNSLLSLARKMLAPDPNNRPSIEQIRRHSWMTMSFFSDSEESDQTSVDSVDTLSRKRLSVSSSRSTHEAPTVALSQPAPFVTSRLNPENLSELFKARHKVCFSQPTHNDDLLISSQLQATQTSKVDMSYLVKRMTRFFVKTSCEKTVEVLRALLDRLHYTWNIDNTGFTVTTVDSRKTQLVFKANIFEMEGKLLLDFRLSRGCGLEFKRRFIKLKNCLSDIILHNTV